MSNEPTIEDQMGAVLGVHDWLLTEKEQTKEVVDSVRWMAATLASLRRLAALERDVLPALEEVMLTKRYSPDCCPHLPYGGHEECAWAELVTRWKEARTESD